MEQPPLLNYRRGWENSRDYLPDVTGLRMLGFDIMPYWFTLFDTATLPGGTLGSLQTGRGRYATPEDCWVVGLVGSSSQAAGFAVQFYDTDRQQLWNAQPITLGNGLGNAGKVFWLRRVYNMPVNAALQCKVTNLATAANAIQVVAVGVRR